MPPNGKNHTYENIALSNRLKSAAGEAFKMKIFFHYSSLGGSNHSKMGKLLSFWKKPSFIIRPRSEHFREGKTLNHSRNDAGDTPGAGPVGFCGFDPIAEIVLMGFGQAREIIQSLRFICQTFQQVAGWLYDSFIYLDLHLQHRPFLFADRLPDSRVERQDELPFAHRYQSQSMKRMIVQPALDPEGFFVAGHQLAGESGGDPDISPPGLFTHRSKLQYFGSEPDHRYYLLSEEALLLRNLPEWFGKEIIHGRIEQGAIGYRRTMP